jgi:hypothetical protein
MNIRNDDRHNLWQEWADKYARRVKKITENPNPKMARSNALLYQVLYDQASKEAEHFTEGSPIPVVYHTENAPDRFFMSMGFRANNLELNADHLSREQVSRYLNIGREFGYPDNICDRVKLAHAIGISGDVPAPSMVVPVVGDCDLMSQAMCSAARYWNVPAFGIDMPYEEELDMGPDEYLEAMKYIKQQLLEFVEFCEKKWPDFIKFDAERLEEYQRINREYTRAAADVIELAKTKPCPYSGRDALRMAPTQVPDDRRVIDYMKQYVSEFREKAKNGESPLKDNIEKFRVYWMCSAPFYYDPFTFLEGRGCASPLYEEGSGIPHRYNVMDNELAERRFGRRMLDPLEEEAALFATHHWGASGNRRIFEVLDNCRKVGIEGIIHFELEGCLSLNNIARITGERAEKEQGIKNFYYLSAHCQDIDKWDEADFEEKLGDWLAMCLKEKGF